MPILIDVRALSAYSSKVSPRAITVFLFLASIAEAETRTCSPRIQWIAEQLGVGRGVVSSAIRELKQQGMIHVEAQRDVDHGIGPNRYTLII